MLSVKADKGKVWKAIVSVNRKVNRNVKYTSDQELFGKAEFWDIVENAGDCDDYAVTKRMLLRKRYPDNHDAFRLATCWVEGNKGPGTGGYHCVLVIVTEEGDYVLDNRYSRVIPYKLLPYKWHRREIPGKMKWEGIE